MDVKLAQDLSSALSTVVTVLGRVNDLKLLYSENVTFAKLVIPSQIFTTAILFFKLSQGTLFG